MTIVEAFISAACRAYLCKSVFFICKNVFMGVVEFRKWFPYDAFLLKIIKVMTTAPTVHELCANVRVTEDKHACDLCRDKTSLPAVTKTDKVILFKLNHRFNRLFQ